MLTLLTPTRCALVGVVVTLLLVVSAPPRLVFAGQPSFVPSVWRWIRSISNASVTTRRSGSRSCGNCAAA